MGSRMKVYRADPAAVDAFVRRRRRVGLVVWPIVMVGSLVLLAAQELLRGFLTRTFAEPARLTIAAFVEPARLTIAAYVVAIFGFFILVTLYPGPRVRAQRASYMLEVTDDDLRRYRDGFLPYTVHRSEVVRISEESSGIVVLTATGWKLNIPRYLEGYDEVRETLRGWRPFETDTARNALSIAISIAWVGGFATMQFAPLGRWWDVGAIVFLAAQAWMIRNWLRELRDPDLTETGRYARVGGIIGYTIFLVSVAIAVLIDLLSALGT
ncbi:MAG TPA: hypothetical protein VNO18_19535 [Xanthobacteraceae bacterium]|nr:hypothetical protein [Xanthobacteraceae bacterium]